MSTNKTEPTMDELDAVLEQIAQGQKDSPPAAAAPDMADAAFSDKASDPDPEPRDAPDADEKIAALEAELADMKDRALRAMADAQNVKKRAEREAVSARAYAIERFAVDMLSVHDNLSRALHNLDGKAREDMGENAISLLEGIELTEKNLMAVLARHGVTAVPGKGSKFDPNVHQAVANIPSTETKGDVAEVMQNGFKLGERTLRAAMVAVSTGPAHLG
ncbi:nucleotide exchange factor GrpE [Robiginitomaculum antarcticum]|uniref:nucleotide exchange factor GrpE n=1 Tax=Robiginitomaculum antarcticum TaxID=437507 RepID=UPI00035F22D1|nr:nucleotide exchange factor GrpE [Robiginitomaculum antarcticum]